jgi:hypothetical protein
MITFYKDRNLTIPKPAIENSYVESMLRDLIYQEGQSVRLHLEEFRLKQ